MVLCRVKLINKKSDQIQFHGSINHLPQNGGGQGQLHNVSIFSIAR
jgi:hypothetical protein